MSTSASVSEWGHRVMEGMAGAGSATCVDGNVTFLPSSCLNLGIQRVNILWALIMFQLDSSSFFSSSSKACCNHLQSDHDPCWVARGLEGWNYMSKITHLVISRANMPFRCYFLHDQHPQPTVEKPLSLDFHNSQFSFLSSCFILLCVVIMSEAPPRDLYSLEVLTISCPRVCSIVTAWYSVWDTSNQQRVGAEWIWGEGMSASRADNFTWKFMPCSTKEALEGRTWIWKLLF